MRQCLQSQAGFQGGTSNYTPFLPEFQRTLQGPILIKPTLQGPRRGNLGPSTGQMAAVHEMSQTDEQIL